MKIKYIGIHNERKRRNISLSLVRIYKMDQTDDEYVMFILVNKDLKMKAGKIASQCCHSACKVVQIEEHKQDKAYMMWKNANYGKIILKADEALLLKCIQKYSDINEDIWCRATFDLGRTQIPNNSLTTVAFSPMLRKVTPDFIKELKLL